MFSIRLKSRLLLAALAFIATAACSNPTGPGIPGPEEEEPEIPGEDPEKPGIAALVHFAPPIQV